ncbi:MAG: hypothetical protein ACFCUE_07180 [Candidatus Bathyarchaeia archaeon]|jgi:hypothetical protein
MKAKHRLGSRVRGWFPVDFKPSQAKENSHPNFKMDRTTTGLVLVLVTSVIMTVTQFQRSNALFALFSWFICVVGLGLLLNVLTALNFRLNMKFMLAAWFAVLSVGGAFVNIYLFSVPVAGITRVFSVSVLAVLHVPYLAALIAYFVGKKEFSSKLMDWLNARR